MDAKRKPGRPKNSEGGPRCRTLIIPVTDTTKEFYSICKKIEQNPSHIAMKLMERYIKEQQPLMEMIERAREGKGQYAAIINKNL